jgi:lysylphosphatidylglycerol synthase-like protein
MYKGEASAFRGVAIRGLQHWRRALPYVGTLLIFTLIFWRIPLATVAAALKQAPAFKFVGVFLPYSAIYWLIDSACLTWVIRRFNKPLRFREILPIRASMYLLSVINTNLGQGGVAWYLHRKARLPLLEILSSILFIALMEVYQLFLFSTAGVVLFRPVSRQQAALVHLLRIVYAVAWCVLAAVMAFFAQARRDTRIREWIQHSRLSSLSRSFVAARSLDYGIVLAIKAPSFALALVAQHFALALYGISIPFLKLVLFLPLVFLAAALPITIAHLGTSQAAWLLFFSGNASGARILAYSLAAHFTFMFCNGFLGLLFLPYASRELTAVQEAVTHPSPAPSREELWRQF